MTLFPCLKIQCGTEVGHRICICSAVVISIIRLMYIMRDDTADPDVTRGSSRMLQYGRYLIVLLQ